MVTVTRVRDTDELTSNAASELIDVIYRIQASCGGLHGDGTARVVLTGGGAGIGTLAKLLEYDKAAEAQKHTFPAQRIDWSRVIVFFGDERNVPVDDPESNEGQAREALLDHVGIPAEHIVGYGLDGGSMDPSSYSDAIAEHAPEGFDVHLLGMGPEGHINSLFPHTAATAEADELVVAVHDSPKPPAERTTLTLPAIARADRVWLLVSGAAKAEAAKAVIDGADPAEWPAAGAHGCSETVLFLDDAAANA